MKLFSVENLSYFKNLGGAQVIKERKDQNDGEFFPILSIELE
jgi:hypothetical protein